jgi:hypothetical protein
MLRGAGVSGGVSSVSTVVACLKLRGLAVPDGESQTVGLRPDVLQEARQERYLFACGHASCNRSGDGAEPRASRAETQLPPPARCKERRCARGWQEHPNSHVCERRWDGWKARAR